MNSVVMAVLVVAIIVFIELISFNNSKQFDLTKNKKYTLTEQSANVLTKFNGTVKALAFFVEGNQLKEAYRDQLERYKKANKNFDFEFIDPNKKPGMAEKYQVAFNGETVLEYAGRQQRIRDVTEEAITNALIKLATEKQKTVYFTTGHGEKGQKNSGDTGLSLFNRYLENEGYVTKNIRLFERVELPKDMSAIVIVGPKNSFYPQEIALLEKYAGQGGSILLFLDSGKTHTFSEFLGKTGIIVGNNVIVDKLSKQLGGDYFTPIVSGFGEHTITHDFGSTLQFALSRTISKVKESPQGVTVTELCFTSPNAWGETDLVRLHDKGEVELEKTDVVGPVSLGVAAVIEEPETVFGAKDVKGKARIAVFGNSDFITNSMIGIGGNLNFILNSVNWLLEDENQISIERAADTSNPEVVMLSSFEAMVILVLSILLVPLITVVVGIRVYIKRKNMQ